MNSGIGLFNVSINRLSLGHRGQCRTVHLKKRDVDQDLLGTMSP